jgi:hypothetical protein
MQHGVRLSTKWVKFCDRLDKPIRDRLYNLMRYCSARRIDPASLDDIIFDEYWRYRAQTTARASNNTARRFMIRAWNACAAAMADWQLRRLTEPPINVTEPAWDAFPEALRKDVDDYFAGLAKVHRTLNGKRLQPCGPGTIRTRRAELVAMARMAVRLGAVPIERLTSSSIPTSPNRFLMPIGKRTATSRGPPPSTSARRCCAWPARPGAWIKLRWTALTKFGSH